MSSLLYHLYPPTLVEQFDEPKNIRPKIALEENMKALSFEGFSIPKTEDYIESRKVLFTNSDLHIGLAAPTGFDSSYFFKNADADEMIFIHEGSGVLTTAYGKISSIMEII